MYYGCETCGQRYFTEHDALDCEKRHAEEKAKREEMDKQRNERLKEIESDWNKLVEKVSQYRNDYNAIPQIWNQNMSLFRWLW